MAFTIGYHHDVPGDTGLTVELYPLSSGSIANGSGGDSLTESANGYYTATVAESLTGIYQAFVVQSSQRIASAQVKVTGTGTYILGDGRIFHADIRLDVDEANTQDEYSVIFFEDDQVATPSGTPTIQVVERDGSDLIAASNMTVISGTNRWGYDASGAERITAGSAVTVVVVATISGVSRTWAAELGRDSTA